MLKPTANRQTHWNFGDPDGNPVSVEEFLAQQEAAGFSFFEGKEPWLKRLHELSWQTFFTVCTEEMDDLSQRAMKLVIEYCLGILNESGKKIRGKVSLARLEDALTAQYDERWITKCTSTIGRYVIPSSMRQSRRRWPTASPLAKRSNPKGLACDQHFRTGRGVHHSGIR